MLKWILIIILSIGLPFIGIPWLIFELWKYYGEKRADAYFDAAMKPLRGTVEKDFNNREDFISQVKNDLASFEQMWRSRKMFSNADIKDLVEERSLIKLGDKYWSLERYEKLCRKELHREPIPELVEEWKYQIEENIQSFISYKKKFNKDAVKIKTEIKKQLADGDNWLAIVKRYENSSLQVSCENSNWCISYDQHLSFFCNFHWAMAQRPNEITFDIKKDKKKARLASSKTNDGKKCHNCGTMVEGNVGEVRCSNCFHTHGGPNPQKVVKKVEKKS